METSKATEAAVRTAKAIAAMDAAVRKVIEQHQRDNAPLAVWQNGRVVWLNPHTMQEVREDSFLYGSAKTDVQEG
jgi:hypothetical protein